MAGDRPQQFLQQIEVAPEGSVIAEH